MSMIGEFVKKIFGTKNQRELKRLTKNVQSINALESAMQARTDTELKGLTERYKQRIKDGESLDSLLPEAFATVREVSRRFMSMRHFDVQLIGGMALHQGKIAEMRTGEGKTLVATLAAYLNALSGQGVHIVTVNDYLSKRDAHWMGPIYDNLGISLGIIQSSGAGENTSFIYRSEAVGIVDKFIHLEPCSRQEAYNAEVVYGTNNEFGFDYLRTNMVLNSAERLQRKLSFAIVDEVDSILIDEARTPLIISGPVANKTELYIQINQLIKPLQVQPEGHTTLLTALDKDEVREFADEPYFIGLNLNKTPLATVNKLRELEQNEELDKAQKREQYFALLDDLKQQLVGDFTIDEKLRSVDLTESGFEKMEAALIKSKLLEATDSLYDAHNLNLLQHLSNALRAHNLFHRNVEYIVQGDEVVLIDEHTGRKMQGRRLSEGLHQAIEAKEKLTIQNESQTLASTTFQNYFRLYDKLSGMTGTADTEAVEFHQIYKLNVLVIPTNQPVNRTDHNDLIFINKEDKFAAVIKDIKEYQSHKAPVLVGTISIETSELMSKMLKKEGIKHNVLNAKFHEQEAEIVATAGEPGRVTIATNMAGRGTDIVLGGNLDAALAAAADKGNQLSAEKEQEIRDQWQQWHDEVIAAGGLHIIGTERHESRRIDNQLRGRSGRQGDPGLSRFYLSMEDDLMRLFASDRVRNMMQSLGMDNGEAIEHRMVSNSIEKAQRRVETRNFDIRKALLEYDDVANDQRMVIYSQRNDLIDNDDMTGVIDSIRIDVINDLIDLYMPPQSLDEQWDIEGLQEILAEKYLQTIDLQEWLEEDVTRTPADAKLFVGNKLEEDYKAKLANFPEGISVHQFERDVMLQTLDQQWRDHLATMDALRSGINLRAYAQKNPKQEYKRESFLLFQRLLEDIKRETVNYLTNVRLLSEQEIEQMQELQRQQEELIRQSMQEQHADGRAIGVDGEDSGSPDPRLVKTYVRKGPKLGRNDPCHCGSGKKYKQCCGKLT